MSDGKRWVEELRGECATAVWARGVKIAREGGVARGHGDPEEEEEFVVRAGSRGAVVRVVLAPEDEDFGSDCECRNEVCEHVAAALVAWREGLVAEDRSAGPARLGYRLSVGGGGVRLRRVIVEDGREQEVTAPCDALVRGLVDGVPAVRMSAADRGVEDVLAGQLAEPVVPPGRLGAVLGALARCEDVTFDGHTVQPSRKPVLPWVVVEDAGDGWRVRLAPDPELTALPGGGLALCGEVLRPVGESGLTGAEREQLTRGQLFSRQEAGRLVGELLPSLDARLPVDRSRATLPGTSPGRPRLVVHVLRDNDADTLAATAWIVYGSPVAARVVQGRLEHVRGDVPLRDPSAEARLEHRLARAGLASGWQELASGDDAVALARRVAALGAEVVGADMERLEVTAAPVVDVTYDPDGRLSATFRTPDGRAADAQAVVGAWLDGRRYAPLLGDGEGWTELPASWLAHHGQRLADLLAARNADGRLGGIARLEAADWLESLDVEVPEIDRRRLVRLLADDAEAPAAWPGDLVADLRGYQREGITRLLRLREAGIGALLADDMGLGKTLQAIASLRGPALVVCPTSVLHEWRDQVARFRPGLAVHTFHGPGRTLDDRADITLTSYAILRSDVDRLARTRWAVAVLDEAQAIKNPSSQVSCAARRLPADWTIALTGTPVENRLEELWSIMAFLNPGWLGSPRDFETRYARPIATGDDDARERLRRRLRPLVLRRTKAEVAPELPERIEVERRCELTDDERAVYDSVRAATLPDVVRQLAEGANPLGALEALLRLRQAACHPGLLPGRTEKTSSKIELLVELLETIAADGHQALIFSQWTSLLDLVEDALRRAGHGWLRLDGSTIHREEVVSAFQAGTHDDCRLMLVSLKAGGTGLNLTAADHVLLLDPWWNPSVEDQAADRAHRIGSTKPVVIHRLVAAGTVEERLLQLQSSKRALADAALGDGLGGGAGLSRGDLLALLD